MRHVHLDRPALITTAPESPDAEYDRRRKRYAIMMAIRALCVIAAALTYRMSIILALVCLVGGAIIPWCAVILANDGPPKKRAPVLGRVANSERQLPAAPSDRTIDE
jgi:hypothetical protein